MVHFEAAMSALHKTSARASRMLAVQRASTKSADEWIEVNSRVNTEDVSVLLASQKLLDDRAKILKRRQDAVFKHAQNLSDLTSIDPRQRAKYDNYAAILHAAATLRAVSFQALDPVFIGTVNAANPEADVPEVRPEPEAATVEPEVSKPEVSKPEVSKPEASKPEASKPPKANPKKANLVRSAMELNDFKFTTLEQCTSLKRAAEFYMNKDDILAVIKKKPELASRISNVLPRYTKATKDELCAAIFDVSPK